MVRLAEEKEDIILEGRLVAQMLTRHRIPALRVYLDASLEVRVDRVVEREGKDREQARTETHGKGSVRGHSIPALLRHRY